MKKLTIFTRVQTTSDGIPPEVGLVILNKERIEFLLSLIDYMQVVADRWCATTTFYNAQFAAGGFIWFYNTAWDPDVDDKLADQIRDLVDETNEDDEFVVTTDDISDATFDKLLKKFEGIEAPTLTIGNNGDFWFSVSSKHTSEVFDTPTFNAVTLKEWQNLLA